MANVNSNNGDHSPANARSPIAPNKRPFIVDRKLFIGMYTYVIQITIHYQSVVERQQTQHTPNSRVLRLIIFTCSGQDRI